MGTEKWNPALLAKNLTEPYTSDKEKVRSIFFWITDNISYRTSAHKSSANNFNKKYKEVPEQEMDSLSLNERIACSVLQQREAVCDGYARLFKTLCDYAGIRSEIISGYARNNANNISHTFHSNHSWNAVYVDSAWQLLDVTWASGYFMYNSNEFIKHFDGSYYLTPPKQFGEDHYPEDLQWTLQPQPLVLQEFYYSPFKFSSFLKYEINSFAPQSGLISASVGDTLHFKIKLKGDKNYKTLAPDGLYDSSMVLPPSIAILKPEMDGNATEVSFIYIVNSAEVEWLQLVYNNDFVLRYKLSIK
jgi:transglutaminase/protease-like cytokinesis protein 3